MVPWLDYCNTVVGKYVDADQYVKLWNLNGGITALQTNDCDYMSCLATWASFTNMVLL